MPKRTHTTERQAQRANIASVRRHIQEQPAVLDKLSRTEVQIIAERVGLITRGPYEQEMVQPARSVVA